MGSLLAVYKFYGQEHQVLSIWSDAEKFGTIQPNYDILIKLLTSCASLKARDFAMSVASMVSSFQGL